MQIVVYHAWKTDVSFPSVNYAERDTNEGGKWKHGAWLEELYQVGWFANTYWKNLICGSLNQWFGRDGRCSQRHLGSWRTKCDVSEHLKVWLGMLTVGFFFPLLLQTVCTCLLFWFGNCKYLSALVSSAFSSYRTRTLHSDIFLLGVRDHDEAEMQNRTISSLCFAQERNLSDGFWYRFGCFL